MARRLCVPKRTCPDLKWFILHSNGSVLVAACRRGITHSELRMGKDDSAVCFNPRVPNICLLSTEVKEGSGETIRQVIKVEWRRWTSEVCVSRKHGSELQICIYVSVNLGPQEQNPVNRKTFLNQNIRSSSEQERERETNTRTNSTPTDVPQTWPRFHPSLKYNRRLQASQVHRLDGRHLLASPLYLFLETLHPSFPSLQLPLGELPQCSFALLPPVGVVSELE